jgi:hypothetical protein
MTPHSTSNFLTLTLIQQCRGMGLSEEPDTIINGLSDVQLVENDTSLDFEFFDPHSYLRGGGRNGILGGT